MHLFLTLSYFAFNGNLTLMNQFLLMNF